MSTTAMSTTAMSTTAMRTRATGNGQVARLVGVAALLVATVQARSGQAEHAGPAAENPARETVAGVAPSKNVACRSSLLTVSRGVVLLDGQAVHPEGEKVRMLVHPIWRRDRCA